jgi:hypothetical protein
MVNEGLSAAAAPRAPECVRLRTAEITIVTYSKAAVDFIASTKSKTECGGRITVAAQGNMKIHELL